MLFDLRGRGKRRTIQAIYLFLAILLGGGLVFFGIGGGGSGGGLLNAVGQNGGGGSNSFQASATAAEKRVALAPTDAAAWAAVGYVDEWLPRMLADTNVRLRAINLRDEMR